MDVPILDDNSFEKSASWKEKNALNEKTLIPTEHISSRLTYDDERSKDLQNYFHMQFKKQKRTKDSKTRLQEYFVTDSMGESLFYEQIVEIQSNDSEMEVDLTKTGEMRQRIHINFEGKLFIKPKKQGESRRKSPTFDRKTNNSSIKVEIENTAHSKARTCYFSVDRKRPWSIQLLLAGCIFIARSSCAAGETITVELATKPVLFDHDVDLVCTIRTENTPNHIAWIKLPMGETLAVNNKTLNNLKYQIKMHFELSAMKYMLRIKKFAQSDVNLLYRCDSEFLSQSENLQLNKEDYIAMPAENEIEQHISISDGYLRGTIQVNSVYPELNNCEAIFEGEDITHHLKTSNSSTTINSIFFNMVIEISHKTEKCKGIINVTCSVGIERIQLMIKDLDECSHQMQDKRNLGLVLGIILPVVGLVILVVVCYRCYMYLLIRKSQSIARMRRYDLELRNGMEI